MFFLILLFALIILNNNCSENYLYLSKISDKYDFALKHIKNIEVISTTNILGFHHYIPESIEENNDLKICKVNNNLWIITKGNPYKFHQGFVSFIYKNKQIICIKNFFPCAWSNNTLANKVSLLITQIKNENYLKICKKKKFKRKTNWTVDTTFKKNIVRVILEYENFSGTYKVKSLFPITDSLKENTNILGSVAIEIWEKQISNLKNEIEI